MDHFSRTPVPGNIQQWISGVSSAKFLATPGGVSVVEEVVESFRLDIFVAEVEWIASVARVLGRIMQMEDKKMRNVILPLIGPKQYLVIYDFTLIFGDMHDQ